jgi:hypothetical protein
MLVKISKDNLDEVFRHYGSIISVGGKFELGLLKDILPYDLNELKGQLLIAIMACSNERKMFIYSYLFLAEFIDKKDYEFLEDLIYNERSERSLFEILSGMSLSDLSRVDQICDKRSEVLNGLLNDLNRMLALSVEIKEEVTELVKQTPMNPVGAVVKMIIQQKNSN